MYVPSMHFKLEQSEKMSVEYRNPYANRDEENAFYAQFYFPYFVFIQSSPCLHLIQPKPKPNGSN